MNSFPRPPSALQAADQPRHPCPAPVPLPLAQHDQDGGRPPADADDFVQAPADGWRMRDPRRDRWPLTRIARQRLLEALRLSDEAESHLLVCLECAAQVIVNGAGGRELCPLGLRMVFLARAGRALAIKHAGGA